MGIFKRFICPLPVLNLSEFQDHLVGTRGEKIETLRAYSLHAMTNGTIAGRNVLEITGYDRQKRLANLGIDPDNLVQMRAFLIREGYMNPNQ